MSSSLLPSFARPPVVETILGVQFDPIPGFGNAHLGAFWSTLGSDWPIVVDAHSLEPQFERFGEQDGWSGFRIKLTQDPSMRIRVKSADGSRMIQVQNGRFHYTHWLGQGSEYPRYRRVRQEFEQSLERFRRFLVERSLNDMRPNQWELTYVNQIPSGTLWQTPADWGKIFAPLSQASFGALSLESLAGEWHFEIPPQKGRLHVHLSHKKQPASADTDIMQLTFTARGPVADDGDVRRGLELGRETIVTSFKHLTSEAAHKHWELLHEDD